MDIRQAKAKLNKIRESTAPSLQTTAKHPKTLIKELCDVIKFLLDEIDCNKDPIVLYRTFPDAPRDKREPLPFVPPNPLRPELPQKSRPINPANPYRKGNAGDAE